MDKFKYMFNDIFLDKSLDVSVLDQLPDAIIAIDSNGKIIYSSLQFEQMFGYSTEEIYLQPLEILMPERFRRKHQEHRINYFNNPGTRAMGRNLELLVLSKHGKEIPVEISLSPLRVANKIIGLAAIRDISEHKKNLIILDKKSKELEEMNEELQTYSNILSHDLKAPLRGIASLITWINEDNGNVLSNESKDYFDMVKQRAEYLNYLIDDVLKYSSIGRKKVEPTEVNIGELICSVVNSLEVESFRINVITKMPIMCTLPINLSQVFANLINNAIKHHDKESGTIEISAREVSNCTYEFSIADDGPGIPQQFKEDIFSLFKTLPGSKSKDSTGVGLSIVKKLIKLQNGKIWVEDNCPRGTVFKFIWNSLEGSK